MVDKFFALRKNKTITMNIHLTEIKNVAHLIEEVNVVVPNKVVVYYTLRKHSKRQRYCMLHVDGKYNINIV